VRAIYYGSIPEEIPLKVGDTSPYDITATRSIRDQAATDQRAYKAAADVQIVVVRSEAIVEETMNRFDQFFARIADQRAEIFPETDSGEIPTEPQASNATIRNLVTGLVRDLDREMDLVVSSDDLEALLRMDPERFSSVRGHARSIATLIMSEPVDSYALNSAINNRIESLNNQTNFNREDVQLIGRILSLILVPNIAYDSVATENARQAAFDKVQNNPVMINRGARIVSEGDVITSETYDLLKELDLIETGVFDFRYLSGILLMVLTLAYIAWFYLKKYENESILVWNNRIALVVAILIPLIASAALARLEPLAAPVFLPLSCWRPILVSVQPV
jgi:membrane-associated HD superfamily phosphohydrolase